MPDSSVQDLPPAETPPSNELPSPPFHILQSLPNFRDIGGWPIFSNHDSPKHLRTNLIYRGPDTTRISPEDIAAIQNLGIATDYDIRSAGQVAKLGFRDLSEYDIRRVWCPVFSDEDMKAEEEGVKRRYEQYASEDVSVRPQT
jgi:hypothetical protein